MKKIIITSLCAAALISVGTPAHAQGGSVSVSVMGPSVRANVGEARSAAMRAQRTANMAQAAANMTAQAANMAQARVRRAGGNAEVRLNAPNANANVTATANADGEAAGPARRVRRRGAARAEAETDAERQARIEAHREAREQRLEARLERARSPEAEAETEEARGARRQARRTREWTRVSAELKTSDPEALSVEERAAVTVHARRMARLERVAIVAAENGNDEMLERAQAAITQEESRYDAQLNAFGNARVSAAAPGVQVDATAEATLE